MGLQTETLLSVSFSTSQGERTLEFDRSFRIGRTEENDVCIPNDYVSRCHAEVTPESGGWTIRDLQSSNGLFVDQQRVLSFQIKGATRMRLGIEGPFLTFAVVPVETEGPSDPGSETTIGRYIDRYFAAGGDAEEAGEQTMMIRRAFARVQKKQRWKFATLLALLAAGLIAAVSYGLYERQVAIKQKASAEELFYTMKSLDVDIANVERLIMASQNQQGMDEVRKYQNRRKQMEKSYDGFLSNLRIYDPKITPQHRLLLRVARIFGECELAMPSAFVSEVDNYIAKWRSSGRLAKAIATAREKGYALRISDELLAQDLPPQFFYLALQESDFDPYISGPVTAHGIAKGMWQFIPETGSKYGLKIGPLFDLRRPDPSDERHHWDLETKAAARYLKDLYSTDAQASGLLVMACYNWGEDRVIPLVRSMPANPRDRNFWRLLSSHREQIPQETYDYVLYIVSAAVIGENPRLFGFDFDNPLAHLEK